MLDASDPRPPAASNIQRRRPVRKSGEHFEGEDSECKALELRLRSSGRNPWLQASNPPTSFISPTPMAKKTKAPKGKAAEAAAPATPPPSWPPFKPALPVTDLDIETLVESKVVVFRSFWPKNLCRDYVSFLKTLPLVTTPGKPKRGDAVRVNDRFQIQDPAFADRLWLETGLKEAILDKSVAEKWWVSYPLILHACAQRWARTWGFLVRGKIANRLPTVQVPAIRKPNIN